MKKILLSAAMMVAAVSFASAQWFVGGNVGFSQSNDEFSIDGGDLIANGAKEKTTAFTIMPKFGYIFNENWMVGLGLGYESVKVKDGAELNGFAVNPYVRYTAWQVGRFSLAFQGDVDVAFGNIKNVYPVKVKTMSYGINIAPVVQFDLTCNVMLESKFNFASLGYNYTQIKADGEKVKNNGFGFGIDTDNAFNTGDIEVGFIVKF